MTIRAEQQCQIAPMAAADRPAVMRIYAEAVACQRYTFVTEAPDWASWDAAHLPGHRLVARCDGQTVGFVALSRLYSHGWLAGIAEVSIYVDRDYRQSGIGFALLTSLQRELEGQTEEPDGIWTLTSFIFPDNSACMRLHERAGFSLIGRSRRIARLGPNWRDVLIYEYNVL